MSIKVTLSTRTPWPQKGDVRSFLCSPLRGALLKSGYSGISSAPDLPSPVIRQQHRVRCSEAISKSTQVVAGCFKLG